MKLVVSVKLTKEEMLRALTEYLERQTRYDYSSPLNRLAVVDWEQRDGEVVLKLEEPPPEEPVEAVPAIEGELANASQEAVKIMQKHNPKEDHDPIF